MYFDLLKMVGKSNNKHPHLLILCALEKNMVEFRSNNKNHLQKPLSITNLKLIFKNLPTLVPSKFRP